MTYGCLVILKSSSVQRYCISWLTKYIWHIFTMESFRENLLIEIQLIIGCKVHILVRFFVFDSFPIHAGGFGFWEVWIKIFSCDFYDELSLWWKVTTFIKSYDFYNRRWPLKTIVIFLKVSDLSRRFTIRSFSNYPLFSINWEIFSHFKNIICMDFCNNYLI